MAVARFAVGKPVANTNTLLYTVERTSLTSVVAVNVGGATRISAWIVPAGKDALPDEWIHYINNIEFSNRNTFETFKIAVNVGDKIYVNSVSGEVTFFINGIYDLAGRANVTTGAQEPESPQIGDIWINDAVAPILMYYWNGTGWLWVHDGIADSSAATFTIAPNATDLTLGGTTGTTTIQNDLVVEGSITSGSWESGVIGIEFGGTGASTAPGAINNLLPTKTIADAGKYLQTDGSTVSWTSVDALPAQTGNDGKFLTTDGADASWANISGGIASDEPPALAIEGQVWLDTDGVINPTSVEIRRWTKTVTVAGTTFSGNGDESIALDYTPAAEQVYLNGVAMIRGSDYSATSGNSITFTTAVNVGDVIQMIILPPVAIASVINNNVFLAKGDIVAASDANTPTTIRVGQDGFVLSADSTAEAGVSWKRASATDDVLMLMGV